MEPAILSRAAKMQTPLQHGSNSFSHSKDGAVTHLKKENVGPSSGQYTVFDRPHGRHKAPTSTDSISSYRSMLGLKLHTAPIQEETVSDSVAEMMMWVFLTSHLA